MSTKQAHPSLVEVARQAGVSPSTVSRVLNNTVPVSDDVRKQVLRATEELGYRHVSHRPVKVPPLNSIALLIPDILNPFFAEIVRGIQDESADEYMTLLMDTAEDVQREKQFFRTLAAQPVCGVIVGGSRIASEELATVIGRQKTPMVVLNRPVHLPHVACLMVDFEVATYRATCQLLNLHHTRIAYLAGPLQSEASQARRRGVGRALSEAGLPFRPEMCPVSFPGVDGGFQAMSALLALPTAERPTAVVAYNDLMALGALHAIRTHRLRVPEDLSVIGIDDISMAAHTNPPLTTIAQPKYRMGRVAMQILRQMIKGQPPPEDGYTLMESPLIVRESTGPAPLNGLNGGSA